MTQEEQKELVGRKVASLVENGTTIGIGTGSTVYYFIDELAKRVSSEGLEVRGVATSKGTEELCKKHKIPLVQFNAVEKIALAVDGADEVDKELNLIKGGGGALTREKIIDYLAEKFVVVIDSSKYVDVLGGFTVAVEVMPFSWFQTKKGLEAIGASVSMRTGKDNKPFVTDNNNHILDCQFSQILKPGRLEMLINNLPGVVENGIFRAEKVDEVWIGYENEVRKMPGEVVV